MPNHLLVVLESARFVEYTLAHAQTIACACGAKLTLLRLLDPVSGKGRNPMVDPLDWRIRKMEAEARLNNLAEGLSLKGLSVNTAVWESSDAEQLIQYAQANDVDLMILTKQSENVGDLAHTVMKHTTTPVIVLPVGGYLLKDAMSANAYQKFLVALDGSQRAEITLPIAATFAQVFNAQLLLVHIVHKPDMPRHAPANAEEIELIERIVEINRADAARYLENFASRLPGDVQTRLLVSDNIAATLHHLIEQEQVDLIILSAHGYSGEPQRPYGNVTNNLIAYSKRPVLLVQDLPAAITRPVDIPAVAQSAKAR